MLQQTWIFKLVLFVWGLVEVCLGSACILLWPVHYPEVRTLRLAR